MTTAPRANAVALKVSDHFVDFFFILRLDEVKDFPRCFTVPYSYSVRNRIIASSFVSFLLYLRYDLHY